MTDQTEDYTIRAESCLKVVNIRIKGDHKATSRDGIRVVMISSRGRNLSIIAGGGRRRGRVATVAASSFRHLLHYACVHFVARLRNTVCIIMTGITILSLK